MCNTLSPCEKQKQKHKTLSHIQDLLIQNYQGEVLRTYFKMIYEFPLLTYFRAALDFVFPGGCSTPLLSI